MKKMNQEEDTKDFFDEDIMKEVEDEVEMENADRSSSAEDEFGDEEDEEDEEDDEAAGGKKRMTAAGICRILLVAIAVVVFCYSGFMLINIYLEYKAGTDIYQSIEASVLTPVEEKQTNSAGEETETPFVYNHEALLSINPDGIGYLYVPSIDVRLPMVQGQDNDYYLTHTFNKNYNGAGALFEDARIENGIEATNVIVYGHNMKNGSMFAGLLKYETPSFYETPGNELFYVYTGTQMKIYQIFSVYISEPVSDTYTYNFSDVQGLQEYAQNMKNKSMYDMKVDVSETTQIMTFSTCTADGSQRVIVHGTYVGATELN